MVRQVLVAVVGLVMLAGARQALAADTYKIDSVHSSVVYKISHLNLANVYGRFNEPTGQVVWDGEDPTKSTFEFEVDAEKVDTGNAKRDAHLKSPDFFDAKQFPKISYKSTKVTKKSDNELELTGDLTMHGVTKPITFTITKTGEGNGLKPGEHRTGWEAQVDLKRTDWGIKGLVGPVGDDVHLTISFEAVKQ